MDLGILSEYDKLSIIANYLLLAATFAYGYLRPKEYTEWIVVSAGSYFLFAFFSAFMALLVFGIRMVIPLIPFALICLGPTALIWAAFFIFLIKSRVQLLSGRQWIIPLILILLSMAQEMAAVLTSDEVTAVLIIFWYLLSAVVVLVGAILLGPLIDRLNPGLCERHLAVERELFGPEAPKKVVFRNGDEMQANLTPGTAMMMGVLYALWMLMRHAIFP